MKPVKIRRNREEGVSEAEFPSPWKWAAGILSSLIVAIAVGVIGGGLAVWQTLAVVKRVQEINSARLDKLEDAGKADGSIYVLRNEWMTDKEAQDLALSNGLASIERQLGFLIDGQVHNRSILEKLPGAKGKP
jgi:hypothetical protein